MTVVRLLIVGFCLAGLVGQTALGTNYTWVADSGNWYDENNWDPVGIPVSNDTAVVGNGTDPIRCIARMTTGIYPHPDSVTVRNNAVLKVYDTLDQVRDQYFIIESGAYLDASDYNNKGWSAFMYDNTKLSLSGNVGNFGETVTVTGAVEVTGFSAGNLTLNHWVYGEGTLTGTWPTNANMRFQRGVQIQGELHVTAGSVQFGNGASTGTGTNSFTLRMDAGTACTLGWRYNSTSSFNGTQHLVLDGVGTNAATVTFTDPRQTLNLQLDTAIIGGEVVAPGTYVVGTDYTNNFFMTKDPPQDINIEVLNEAVLEPVSTGAVLLVM
jgi:hypothetical protein